MNNLELIEFLKEDSQQNARAIEILEKLEEQEKAMTKAQIMAYAHQIKPVMRGDQRKVSLDPNNAEDLALYWVESVPICTQSVTFNCTKPLKQALGLQEIARITTYHRYGGYYGLLRPSTDEAIVQCPKEILDQVCAFEFSAATLSTNLDASRIYDSRIDRHVLTTIYYSGVLPREIAEQEVLW